MRAVYNEIEPYAAAWLHSLVAAGHIAPGTIETRSIADLEPADVAGDGQRHFFAGIGVWSYALRLAGWPDDLAVWTGSCPCQPFSGAGKRGGFDDERHLWPAWFELIRKCRPAVVLGEQVASKDGLAWLDAVYADLEGAGYAVGAADTCAAGVGAPHIRQRLYFVAYADEAGFGELGIGGIREVGDAQPGRDAYRRGSDGGMADNEGDGRIEGRRPLGERAGSRDDCGLGDTGLAGSGRDARAVPRAEGAGDRERRIARGERDEPIDAGAAFRSACDRRPWEPCEWVWCRDGKSRPVEPGTFPLAHGAPSRVGRLRAYGNAIVAEQAATFIEAVMDVLELRGAA